MLSALETRESGLDAGDAAARLVRYGSNELTVAKPASAVAILIGQLESVIVWLLAAAVAVSLISGDHVEAAAIAAVLAINTLIGFLTELRARRAIEALHGLDVPQATVLRAGQLHTVAARGLVPGDVIELEAGHQVAADARLIKEAELRTDEAALTGESLPVSKSADARQSLSTPLAERVTMVYKGTTVVAGHGRAVVTATGSQTEVGRIGVLVSGVTEERTPLERRLDVLGRRLVWATIAVAAVVAGLGVAQGHPAALVFETAIALAVAAVPEALPVVATVALAVGVHRMARRRALVRRLPVVEALGATTVICTDKTRTLTSGEMSVVRLWTAGREVPFDGQAPTAGVPSDDGARRLLEAAALASRPQAHGAGSRADPVDAAMFAAARAANVDGVDGAGRAALGTVPFSSERKRMAVFYPGPGHTLAYVKGAPRAVLGACTRVVTADGARDLDERGREALDDVNEKLAGESLRVLAVASGAVAEPSESALKDLTALGFIGLADPPARGVQETIAGLKAAGLRTVMLTGDQRLTAESVGRAVGVLAADARERAIDGQTLDQLSDGALGDAVARHSVFTRITPEHKLRIVRALQARGEIVAMLGDGINDAPALKQADVGVAMGGRGTDVAKQAASIVLQDDRFETIAAAVEEGRAIFDNIEKFVFYLFSCNVAEVLVLLVAGLSGLPLPLFPMQLLWLNLLTDTFPALALAMEPAATGIMRRPPRRPDDAILSRRFIRRTVVYASLITGATLAAFLWGLRVEPARATTLAFMTLAFAQIGHLGNARSRETLLDVRRAFANPFAILGAGTAMLLQILAATVPALSTVLHVVPLDGRDWIVVIGLSAVPAIVGEVAKRFRAGSGVPRF